MAVVIPIHNGDAVNQPFPLIVDDLAFPITRPVKNERNFIAIVGRFRMSAGERRVDHNLFTASIDIGPAKTV